MDRVTVVDSYIVALAMDTDPLPVEARAAEVLTAAEQGHSS